MSVQNNITAETLYGKTLPAKTLSSSDLDSGHSSCFSAIAAFYTVTVLFLIDEGTKELSLRP